MCYILEYIHVYIYGYVKWCCYGVVDICWSVFPLICFKNRVKGFVFAFVMQEFTVIGTKQNEIYP